MLNTHTHTQAQTHTQMSETQQTIWHPPVLETLYPPAPVHYEVTWQTAYKRTKIFLIKRGTSFKSAHLKSGACLSLATLPVSTRLQ